MIKALEEIKEFFNTDKTKLFAFRLEQLKKLKSNVLKHKNEITEALYKDLHKPKYEVYLTEIAPVIRELDFAINNLKDWMKEKELKSDEKNTNLLILNEPYGIVLNIVPFNYPFQLALVPLIGIIAAGNCAAIRTSKRTPETSKVLNKIIGDTFESCYIKMFMPESISYQELLDFNFNYVFFTGSTKTGIEIAKTLASRLIPYTLELGGKSPVIVDNGIDLELSAQRIIKGKLLNMGQTCIAPDYLLVHKNIKPEFIEELKKAIKKFYSYDAQYSKDYGRIIDTKAFRRIESLIKEESKNVVFGGKTDECGLYIEPTIIDSCTFESNIMKEEIFGPVLPVIEWSNQDEVINKLKKLPSPLALYVFSKNEDFIKNIVKNISFGGGSINDTLKHTQNPAAPFGGVGMSGIGQYHGKYSFETFSRKKTIFINNNEENNQDFFPPYTDEKFQLIKEHLNF